MAFKQPASGPDAPSSARCVDVMVKYHHLLALAIIAVCVPAVQEHQPYMHAEEANGWLARFVLVDCFWPMPSRAADASC